ncbi:MAG TPA: DMT family transporter [Caulobacteraceae bacterium]|jgi:drug/metabolite transporter (DMT)-like permease|nr:DMT family transporter [Caulobacteraceae bacterium]
MTAPSTSNRFALAVLLAGACVIGFAPILARLTETGPAAGGFWRMLFAVPLLAWPALRAKGTLRAGVVKAGLWAGVLFAIDLGIWHYAVRYTSVTNATALSNTTPVVVTAVAWLMFKERPSVAFLGALVLALGGAFVMAAAKGSGGLGTQPVLGDLLALGAALFYGGYFVVVRLQRREGVSTAALMLWTSVAAVPTLLIAALALHEPIFPAGPGGWLACAGLGLMHATGQGAIAWALGRLPASLTSVVVLIQPVAAAALGWSLLGEPVTLMQGVGAVVLLAGVVLAQRSTLASAEPAPPVLPETPSGA